MVYFLESFCIYQSSLKMVMHHMHWGFKQSIHLFLDADMSPDQGRVIKRIVAAT